MAADDSGSTGIIHRRCGAYLEWTGEAYVYRCCECGETVDLAAIDEDDDDPVSFGDVRPSPTCPECGAPIDDHNSRGECPPF